MEARLTVTDPVRFDRRETECRRHSVPTTTDNRQTTKSLACRLSLSKERVSDTLHLDNGQNRSARDRTRAATNRDVSLEVSASRLASRLRISDPLDPRPGLRGGSHRAPSLLIHRDPLSTLGVPMTAHQLYRQVYVVQMHYGGGRSI